METLNEQLIDSIKNRDLWDLNEIKSLIDNGADVNAEDEDGWTPLHFSSYDLVQGNPEVFSFWEELNHHSLFCWI